MAEFSRKPLLTDTMRHLWNCSTIRNGKELALRMAELFLGLCPCYPRLGSVIPPLEDVEQWHQFGHVVDCPVLSSFQITLGPMDFLREPSSQCAMCVIVLFGTHV